MTSFPKPCQPRIHSRMQIALLLGLLAVALALFWWERISSEVVALGLMLALAFTGRSEERRVGKEC